MLLAAQGMSTRALRRRPAITRVALFCRRATAVLLAVIPLHAAAAAVGVPVRDAHGQCTDHLCRCARHEAPAPNTTSHCHEEPEDASACRLEHAGCDHGQLAAAPEVTRPHLIPPTVAVATTHDAAAVASCADDDAAAGFLDIDLPPPRTRA